MTPKEIEDIRSWRRGEWAADITEIESMVYGLVDELNRLRAAAEFTKRAIETRTELLARLTPHRPTMAQQFDAGGIDALERLLRSGRELGLWE
jgi:hypothetical protein